MEGSKRQGVALGGSGSGASSGGLSEHCWHWGAPGMGLILWTGTGESSGRVGCNGALEKGGWHWGGLVVGGSKGRGLALRHLGWRTGTGGVGAGDSGQWLGGSGRF